MLPKKTGMGGYPSYSAKFIAERDPTPQISAIMANNVSGPRRIILADETAQGYFRDGSSKPNQHQDTGLGNVVASYGIKKQAQGLPGQGGVGFGGHGDTVMQSPEVYSPLWLNSNLSLPRDRATINAWCRSFFALNPFVHNAISLHSTYPISKLSIKCPNKDIEKFFNDMIEEIDLMNTCIQIAQEYWLLGEAFVYAELDEGKGKWSRLHIQNPDFMIVKKTVVASDPVIMLRPDENLKKIIFSNSPADIEQRKQLNQQIIDNVRRGQNIPLNNFHVSHLARRISPYEIRGTGLPVCIFRDLMLFDRLRECYSDDTEVLTDDGFKKIADLVLPLSQVEQNPNFVNGAVLDATGQIESILSLKENFKVACFNPETEAIEYHKPTGFYMSKYVGKMVHFKSRAIDTLVSPNHQMWLQKKNRIKGMPGWNNWEKVKASEISPQTTYRFRSLAKWEGRSQEYVQVLDKQVPIDLYLKFLGYTISEGYLGQWHIDFIQAVNSDCLIDMQNTMREMGKLFDKTISERICTTEDYEAKGFLEQPADRWNGRLYSKDLMDHFINEIGSNGKTTSEYKRIPAWAKELDSSSLSVLLETLTLGDGSHISNRQSLAWRYYTVSKILGDDVQEIAFKCGFAPSRTQKKLKSGKTEYRISWSNATDGNFPILTPRKRSIPQIKEVDYDGIVWCFEVPTGLFITRRNQRMAIHGNSKFVQADTMINPTTVVKIGSADYKPNASDLEAWRSTFEAAESNKSFKIFTHEGVDIQRVGFGQGIFDTSGDITQVIKEIMIGLFVPQVVLDGGSDTSYANGGVALDVLRERYMSFRNMLSAWLRMKIFAPISKIQGFYDYSGGEKQLIVPEIDWNHMALFDTTDYIQALITLTTGDGPAKRVSVHTLYRSIGLEYEDEVRKMRKEAIQNAIAAKEATALAALDLNALRSLDDEDEIPEQPTGQDNTAPAEPPLPGQDSSSGVGLPDLGLPGGSPPPPSPGGSAPPAGPPPTPPAPPPTS